MKWFLLILGFNLFLFSCEKNESKMKFQSQKTVQNFIVNGKVITADKAPYNSVVGLYDSDFHFACTGTLIASATVLTAAHCIEKNAQSLYVVFANHLNEAVMPGFDLTINTKIRKVTNATVHPDYESESHQELGQSDLAIIHFEGQIPSSYSAIQMDNSFPQKSEKVVLSGFGVSEVKISSLDGSHTPNILDLVEQGAAICFDKKNIKCALINMTGDGPLRSTVAPVNSIEGNEFLNNESDSGTCSGDSGGPAFRLVGGRYVLTGVTSRGSLSCNKDGVYTIVSKYASWINSKLK